MQRLNYDEAEIDRFGNVVGRIGEGRTKIIFDAHLDTPGIGDRSSWRFDPYQGDLKAGKVYGHGAANNKGGLAAAVFAGAIVRELDLASDCTVYVIGSIQAEECEGLAYKALFDVEKLEWLNGQHMSRMSGAELAAIAAPWFERAGIATTSELSERSAWFADLVALVKTRSRTLHDLVQQGRPFFPGPVEYQADAIEKFWRDPAAAGAAIEVASEYVDAEDRWGDLQAMEARLRALAAERGIGAGAVMQSMRVALTGQRVSPGIFETLAAMGPEVARARLAAATMRWPWALMRVRSRFSRCCSRRSSRDPVCSRVARRRGPGLFPRL